MTGGNKYKKRKAGDGEEENGEKTPSDDEKMPSDDENEDDKDEKNDDTPVGPKRMRKRMDGVSAATNEEVEAAAENAEYIQFNDDDGGSGGGEEASPPDSGAASLSDRGEGSDVTNSGTVNNPLSFEESLITLFKNSIDLVLNADEVGQVVQTAIKEAQNKTKEMMQTGGGPVNSGTGDVVMLNSVPSGGPSAVSERSSNGKMLLGGKKTRKPKKKYDKKSRRKPRKSVSPGRWLRKPKRYSRNKRFKLRKRNTQNRKTKKRKTTRRKKKN